MINILRRKVIAHEKFSFYHNMFKGILLKDGEVCSTELWVKGHLISHKHCLTLNTNFLIEDKGLKANK